VDEPARFTDEFTETALKIAVLDDYKDSFRTIPAFERLKGHEVVVFNDTEKDPLRLAQRIGDAEVVVLTQQRSPLPRAVIERLPRLKLVAQTGSHTDHFDIAACTEKGIAIAGKGKGQLNSTAELTWGLVLASLRHIPQEAEQLKRGSWQTTVGSTLSGKTLGIYALGKIGAMVAQVGVAFGMKVSCWGREGSLARAREAGYEVPASRVAFFESVDVLALHIPLEPHTRGIIKASDLARMKPTALLVNTSRAGLIEDGALVEALKRGRPGHAAVDVYETEPVVGGNHPLLGLPNALCTPHLGYNVRELYESLYSQVIDNIVAFVAGKPTNLLNPEALSARR
jgi:D-3-phosphoglycerate dehydrogenase / 2-oxoglutarate reductase